MVLPFAEAVSSFAGVVGVCKVHGRSWWRWTGREPQTLVAVNRVSSNGWGAYGVPGEL